MIQGHQMSSGKRSAAAGRISTPKTGFFVVAMGSVNGLTACLPWGGLVSAAVGVIDGLSQPWTYVLIKGGLGIANHDLI